MPPRTLFRHPSWNMANTRSIHLLSHSAPSETLQTLFSGLTIASFFFFSTMLKWYAYLLSICVSLNFYFLSRLYTTAFSDQYFKMAFRNKDFSKNHTSLNLFHRLYRIKKLYQVTETRKLQHLRISHTSKNSNG